MSAALTQFHFLRPWWLLLLLLWPPLLWQLGRVFGAREALTRLVDAALLPHLLERHGAHRRWPLALPPLAALLATLALAGPTWQRLPQPQYSRNAPQVIALSLSRHMLARDVTPDRLARARYKIHALLAANADGENGLIAYAGDAFVVAPLTTDAHALGTLLDSLSPDVMPVRGDAAERAIDRGVRLLHDGGVAGGALVLVTDTADAAAVDAARRALAAGVRVSVLGVGSARGAPVTLPGGGFLHDAKGGIAMARRDDARLRAVAAAGGGRYQVMTDDGSDVRALSAAEQRARRGGVLALAQADRWRDFGPWLLLPLLPLAALAFRRGWLLALPLMLLPLWPLSGHAAPSPPAVQPRIAEVSPKAGQGADPPPPAGWRDRWWSLWLNADQRARRALDAGHPRRAQQLAHDPALRGAAAYRAGDFAAAGKAFAAASGSDAAYDRGNALVRQGHFEDGLKAYAQALKLDPENHDAAVNRKAVEDWLKKQQKQPLQGRPKPDGKNAQQGRDQRGGPGGNNQSDPHQAPKAAPPKTPGGPQSRPSPQSPPAGGATAAPPPTPPPPSSSSSAPAPTSSSPAPTQRPQSSRSPNPATARQQQNQARNAGQALKSRMDQELDKKTSQPQPYALGNTPASGSSSQELPRSMEQALQRVPDDPGGLLRRKFELEMQQRNGDQRGEAQ